MKWIAIIAVVVGTSMSSCARRVVVNPDVVPQKNSADWTVKSEPRRDN